MTADAGSSRKFFADSASGAATEPWRPLSSSEADVQLFRLFARAARPNQRWDNRNGVVRAPEPFPAGRCRLWRLKVWLIGAFRKFHHAERGVKPDGSPSNPSDFLGFSRALHYNGGHPSTVKNVKCFQAVPHENSRNFRE